LNSISHDTAINLIKSVLKMGVKLKKVYVDTVGPPSTYQEKLQVFYFYLLSLCEQFLVCQTVKT